MINRKNQKKFNLFNTNNKMNYKLNQKEVMIKLILVKLMMK